MPSVWNLKKELPFTECVSAAGAVVMFWSDPSETLCGFPTLWVVKNPVCLFVYEKLNLYWRVSASERVGLVECFGPVDGLDPTALWSFGATVTVTSRPPEVLVLVPDRQRLLLTITEIILSVTTNLKCYSWRSFPWDVAGGRRWKRDSELERGVWSLPRGTASWVWTRPDIFYHDIVLADISSTLSLSLNLKHCGSSTSVCVMPHRTSSPVAAAATTASK